MREKTKPGLKNGNRVNETFQRRGRARERDLHFRRRRKGGVGRRGTDRMTPSRRLVNATGKKELSKIRTERGGALQGTDKSHSSRVLGRGEKIIDPLLAGKRWRPPEVASSVAGGVHGRIVCGGEKEVTRRKSPEGPSTDAIPDGQAWENQQVL